MIRRVIAVSALLIPGGLFVGFSACSDNTPPENLCGWLGDSNNCYARFVNDIGTHCGKTFEPDSDVLESATGSFGLREELATCVLNAGGQVIFDPPPDVTTFPPTSLAFTILDWQGTQCAAGSWSDVTGEAPSSQQSFSITIDPVIQGDAGIYEGDYSDHILGGTFSSAIVSIADTDPVEYRNDAFDISCPGGLETHRFDRLHLLKCDSKEELLPQAIVDSSPGIQEPPPNVTDPSYDSAQAGYVRLRIVYPPAAGATEPQVVEYFNCSIPAPPPPCADGIKDNDESDIDCGGSCPTKCAEGLACIDTDDCDTGLTCTAVQGLRLCTA